MSMTECPHCHRQFHVPPDMLGQATTCSRCKGRFEISIVKAPSESTVVPDFAKPQPATTPIDDLNEFVSRINIGLLLYLAGAVIGLLLLGAIVGPRSHFMRVCFLSAAMVFELAGAVVWFSLHRRLIAIQNAPKITIMGTGLLIAGGLAFILAPRPAAAHPLFHTPLTMAADARPAIQVDILDADTHMIFQGYYDLYLSVQSSRFLNADTRVLFPLNVGSFQGCNSKFIQLPFEVSTDDELVFELVYPGGLSDDEQRWMLKASAALGYCLALREGCYQPDVVRLLEPAFVTAAETVAEGINFKFQQRFYHLAKAECIVEVSRPHAPQQANRITLVEDAGKKKLARATVKLYYPLWRLD